MEQVLQRKIDTMEKEYTHHCQSFRNEVSRLQARCSELQMALAMERVKVGSEISLFAKHHDNHGFIRTDLLLRFLAFLANNREEPAAPVAEPQAPRKRSREDEVPGAPEAKRHLSFPGHPSFTCNVAASRHLQFGSAAPPTVPTQGY
eukprot:TRINITY_DN1034_c0_g1_i1.p3 TRINITY_DN1034_c0_g1~~TRINITY_DN1034_c0_g1_i1.p3  ORF type:complete len:147 (+),score=27.77 TRINITY_DN1034_c0_g1_i1:41-481(+)